MKCRAIAASWFSSFFEKPFVNRVKLYHYPAEPNVDRFNQDCETKEVNTTMSENQLKELLKTAVAEVFEERRDLIADAVEEAMEDMALSRAIASGQNSPFVDREQVMRALARKK